MRNLFLKYSLLVPISIFILLSFSSVVFAGNYGEGAYSDYLYSAQKPSSSSGSSQASRDKFLAEQQALALQQQPTTIDASNTPEQPISGTKIGITKTLKLKMTHNDVKLLQKYLNNHGYVVSTTGAGSLNNESNYFGAKTKQAVMKFQKANGLKADGVVGPKTIEKMK